MRIAVDNVLSRGLIKPLVDVLTNANEIMWQAEDVQVELGIFSNGTIIGDPSNLVSVTFEVKDPNNLDGAPLISSVQTTINTISLPNWTNGTQQNCLFVLTAAQTNIALLTAQQKTLNAYFFALTADPFRFPLGWGTFQLADSGYGDLGSTVVTPPGARMKNNRLQIQCVDDNLYYDTVYRHVAGTLALSSVGPGQS